MAKNVKSRSVAQVASLAMLHTATKGKGSEADSPWTVIIPSLGVSMPLVDENNNSITGYIERSKASAMVQAIANELLSDREYLTTVRQNPQHIVLAGHFDGLGTVIHFPVYLPENLKV